VSGCVDKVEGAKSTNVYEGVQRAPKKKEKSPPLSVLENFAWQILQPERAKIF